MKGYLLSTIYSATEVYDVAPAETFCLGKDCFFSHVSLKDGSDS